MTSVETFSKQIPLNNGYFRIVPSLIPDGAPGVSSYMYTLNNGVPGLFAPNGAVQAAAISTGAMLLRDMGTNVTFSLSNAVTGALSPYYSGAQYNTPLSFRRVQLVDYFANVPTPTDGVGGSSTGVDSDYQVCYIQLGLKGNAVPGPFIRTG